MPLTVDDILPVAHRTSMDDAEKRSLRFHLEAKQQVRFTDMEWDAIYWHGRQGEREREQLVEETSRARQMAERLSVLPADLNNVT